MAASLPSLLQPLPTHNAIWEKISMDLKLLDCLNQRDLTPYG